MDSRRGSSVKVSARRRPRHALTAGALGRRIVGGALAPGAVLPNADLLAREYQVSRPALREAIKLLAGKGLLEMAPRRGTVVRPKTSWNRLDDDVMSWETGEAPSPTFIRDLFELRRMIEPEAAALAAMRASGDGIAAIERALMAMSEADAGSSESIQADLAFHRAILIHSCNEFLATFAPAIEAYLTATFNVQRRSRGPNPNILKEHGAIYRAIRDRDPGAAREATLALLTPAEGEALAGLSGGEEAASPDPTDGSAKPLASRAIGVA